MGKNNTSFQSKFSIDHAKEIVRIMHPELTEEQVGWTKMYKKYTWICINFRVKGYGIVDMAIDNHAQGITEDFGLYGPDVTHKDIQRALNKGSIGWKVWRMTLDKRFEEYKEDAKSASIYPYEAKEHGKVYNLLKNKYQLPSVKEFYYHYYSD